ncbi:MAG TPA: transposase [Pseudonocardiaceae bacterium]|nr:transposase [Pseudonocardiaceae bacterium]
MQLRYNFRVEPTPGQRTALARAFGCARVVFNDGLRAREQAYRAGLPYLTDAELMRQVLTEAKQTEERAWLAEVSSVVLQQAVADLNTAYRNFFASITGKRKGHPVGRPHWRSRKDNRHAIRFTRNARFAVTNTSRLRLPKIGDLRVRWSRALPAEPSSVTVIKDAAGRYFASFVVDTEPGILPEIEADTGIDLGLSCFAAFPDGRTVTAPKFLRRAERTLTKLQRALSRKEKGSRNRAKARVRVARAHARVANSRRDWYHKLSTTIIRENQAVYVEDLAVSGLARGRLAKSVHDAGWSAFVSMLEYKAAKHGRVFARIGRFEPTTRTCSGCGWYGPKLGLSVRIFRCAGCPLVLDRDVNAARNILAAGRKLAAATRREAESSNACGAPVRPGGRKSPAGRVRPAPRGKEAGTHRKAIAHSGGQAGIPVL